MHKPIPKDQKLELLQFCSELGFWDWNLKTNEVHYDERWCTMLGYQPNELEHRFETWQSLVEPSDGRKAQAAFKAYLNDQADYYEVRFRMKHKAGHWVPILSKGKVVEWDEGGKPLRFAGTHFDLSIQEEQLQEQKQREELTRQIQKDAKIGGWVYRIEDQSIYWTEETYRIHEVFDGSKIDVNEGISFYAPGDQERIRSAFEKCVKKGEEYSDRFEIKTATGKTKFVKAAGRPIRDELGNIIAVRGTFQDVTTEVLTEKSLELERMKAIQSAKLASLGQIAADVAHEINNPLAIIYGYIGSAERFLDQEDYGKAKERLDKILSASQRISRIVSGLRKFGKEDDSFERVGPADFNRIIDDVLAISSARMRKFGIEFKNLVPEDAFILCSQQKLSQVLISLLNNSIEAIKDLEEKWISVETKEVTLNDEAGIEIHLADSGKGLPDDVVERLFEPLFSMDGISSSGLGLGLSIARSLVEEMGGELSLCQKEANTCFHIRLPKAEGHSERPSNSEKL